MTRVLNQTLRAGLFALGAAFVAVTGVTPAFSQAVTQEISPDQLNLARQYVELTDTGKVYETTLLQAGVLTMKTVIRDNPEVTEQAKTAIGEVIKSYVDNKGDLIDQFARVYALKFTADELKQIVDFYSTPVGKKLAAENRDINAGLQKVLKVFTNNLKVEFMAKVRANLKEKGIAL